MKNGLSASITKQDIFKFLQVSAKILITTVVVAGVIAFWLIRVWWWLSMICLGIIGFIIQLLLLPHTGGRLEFNMPSGGAPGFKMPDGLLDQIQNAGGDRDDRQVREEVYRDVHNSSTDQILEKFKGLEPTNSRESEVLQKIRNSPGKKLEEILTQEEMDVFFWMLMAALGAV